MPSSWQLDVANINFCLHFPITFPPIGSDCTQWTSPKYLWRIWHISSKWSISVYYLSMVHPEPIPPTHNALYLYSYRSFIPFFNVNIWLILNLICCTTTSKILKIVWTGSNKTCKNLKILKILKIVWFYASFSVNVRYLKKKKIRYAFSGFRRVFWCVTRNTSIFENIIWLALL